MLRIVSLPVFDYGSWWHISTFNGSLKKMERAPLFSRNSQLPKVVADNLEYVRQPYTLRPYLKELGNRTPNEYDSKLGKMHDRLLAIGNERFLLSVLYAGIEKPLYETTAEAMRAINRLPVQRKNYGTLCFQRSLLAAKVSRSFQKGEGVIFLGAFLPTALMHAWVIENGAQPDSDDRDWIMYRPLMAIHKS